MAPLTRFRDLWLITPPGVFAPRSDAGMLLDAVAGRLTGTVLDLGTGSGVLALTAARTAGHVVAVDTSRSALLAARLNARINRRRVELVHGALFAPLGGRRFDMILSNPPYLPSSPKGRRLGSNAWDGGRDGRAVLDQICDRAARHLRPGGEVVVVHSSLARVGPTLELLERRGLDGRVLASHTGPLGPLAREAAKHMVGESLLDAVPAEEQVVVISGRAPG